MKALRFLALALCAAVLAGCWMSDKPLMPKEQMEWPQFEPTYLTETPSTAKELESVVSITRQADHYELSETFLYDKNWTARYALNFDELKPGWYLVQISPVSLPSTSQLDANRIYYKLLHTDGTNWQEFSFWRACPKVPENMRRNLEDTGQGCSFKNYSTLRSQALLATDRLSFVPSSHGALQEAGLSEADYDRTLNAHHGPIPWSRLTKCDDFYCLGDFVELSAIAMAAIFLLGVILPAAIWLLIGWRSARRSSG